MGWDQRERLKIIRKLNCKRERERERVVRVVVVLGIGSVSVSVSHAVPFAGPPHLKGSLIWILVMSYPDRQGSLVLIHTLDAGPFCTCLLVPWCRLRVVPFTLLLELAAGQRR